MHMAFSLLEIFLTYPEATEGLSFVLGLPAFCDVQ